MWITKFLVFQGGVLDLLLLTALPLMGVSTFLDAIPYANATVVVGSGRSAEAFTVPKATIEGMYLQTIFGVVRLLAGLRPKDESIWLAAMASMLVEFAVTVHCALALSPSAAIMAGDKPLMDELMPGSFMVLMPFVWMLATYPKKKD